MTWDAMPTMEEVREVMQEVATTRAQVRIATLELELFEARMDQIKPRSTSAKKLGVDDATLEESLKLRRQLIDYKNQLDKWEMALEFLNYRKELYKAEAYRVRA